ncbi:MAG: hypothetical protein EOP08_10820 [Proteobacteria bacterium]|nr:MAG: hypothetical protein EOP08_10820 [Pseudomonadota bacterium]
MKRIIASALAGLGLLACSSDEGTDGTGTVAFTTWGEEYIEQEIPASEFADGWTVKYTKFLVVLSDIEVASGGTVGAKSDQQQVFDMVAPGVKPVFTQQLGAKNWETVNYRIGPATAAAVAGPGLAAADKDKMVAGGFSLYVEGTGSKGGVVKRFAWGFDQDTTYKNCKGEVAGAEQSGAIVTNGGTDTIQLTIHGDHMFYDDLASADAKLRFVNVADADANDDGEVTLDELAAVERADLKEGTYQVGGFSNVFTYKDFVTELSRTVGHFRGEGECEL